MTASEPVHLRKELACAIEAARHAGEVLERWFRSIDDLVFDDKGSGDIVSAADREADAAIASCLRDRFPSYRYHSEEAKNLASGDGPMWVVDPLDGTNNFAAGIPQFSVSIALVQDHQPVLGVVYNPTVRRLAYAEKGRGAVLDGLAETERSRSIGLLPEASNQRRSRDHRKYVVALDVPYGGDQLALRALGALTGHVRRVLVQWAPALDYVALAAGRIDAVVCLGAEMEDKLAGLLIAAEAGCCVHELSTNAGLRPYAPDARASFLPWCISSRDSQTAIELANLLLPCAVA